MRRSSAPSRHLGPRPPGFSVPNRSRAAGSSAAWAPLPGASRTVTGWPTRRDAVPEVAAGAQRVFSVIWCKLSGRKHKKWEDDAFLIVKASQRTAILQDTNGREVSRATGLSVAELERLGPGGSISLGGKEIEILTETTEAELASSAEQAQGVPAETRETEGGKENVPQAPHRPPVISHTVFKPFTVPARFGTHMPSPQSVPRGATRASLFSQNSVDALVLPRPPFHFHRDCEDVVDVVVDPHLTKHLRPHQRQGVIFLYECIMGFKEQNCHGAILADEMGLGKTLQTISLIWTLLKQGPFQGQAVVKRALILTPSSLVKNWECEFLKWLGRERIQTFAVDGGQKVSEAFKRIHLPVLIMSYEMFNKSFDDIQRFLKFDLIVCDEGHRLKNDKIKASTFLSQLACDRRVVLTGTPLQNDLKEFYAIMCVVNPDLVGTAKDFARKFEDPIVRSKQPEATPDEVAVGGDALEVLNGLTGQFILRRTQDIISQYLPPKSEMVLFCRPSALQSQMYEHALSGLGGSYLTDSSCVLASITRLRKICNHPSLYDDGDASEFTQLLAESTFEEQGSKLAVVSHLLHNLKAGGQEKIVLVSISTQVLDILGELCSHYDYPFLRLDGSTSSIQRLSLVNRFNDPLGKDFVLLLSSKAGGTGLNLIGASRILLYDMDWNPAHDIQAMARVWRDGQKRPVHVYRLVTSGTIEEKIYQRQITKQGLGGGLLEGLNTRANFSQTDLKDLFSFRWDRDCETHDLLDCACVGDGTNNAQPATEDLGDQNDLRPCQIGDTQDPTDEIASNGLTGLLQCKHIRPGHGPLEDAALEDVPNIVYAFKSVFNTTNPSQVIRTKQKR